MTYYNLVFVDIIWTEILKTLLNKKLKLNALLKLA